MLLLRMFQIVLNGFYSETVFFTRHNVAKLWKHINIGLHIMSERNPSNRMLEQLYGPSTDR